MLQSFFDQHMVNQRINELQREATMAHAAAQVHKASSFHSTWKPLRFPHFRHQHTNVVSHHIATEHDLSALPTTIPMKEMRPALLMTFTTMRDKGLVSDFDERFIETFMRTFEQEIMHQSSVATGRKTVQ
jgi:hypothetical protein